MADNNTDKKIIKILFIDGGGIRGIVPAIILSRLEDHLHQQDDTRKREIWEHFDLIAGTSTGGIITMGLVAPDKDQDPPKARLRPKDLVRIYETEGRTIFPRWEFGLLRSLRQIEDEKYAADGLEQILDRVLGDLRTDEALTNFFITAYDTETRSPVIIKNRPVQYENGTPKVDAVYRMRDAVRATTAAPTYFEAHQARPVNAEELPYPKGLSKCLIDGGVYMNNPALSAYIEAKKIWGDDTKIFLVSLGTGITNRPYYYRKVKDWGAREWLNPLAGMPLINVMMDGQSDSVHHHLKELLDDNYVRFNGPLEDCNDDMDDASKENIENLKMFAEKLMDPEAKFKNEMLDQRWRADLHEIVKPLEKVK